MAGERSGGLLSGSLGTLYSLGRAGELTDGQLLGRFLAREDAAESEAAFAALVERHGAMVLRVCQRILGDPHDAHDAFQAAFLLLVRKAGSIRNRESVADWLFRIARRVAVRAGIEAARRRRRLEDLAAVRRSSLADSPATPPLAEPDHAALIAEVDRLPERFRAAVVLYYFEGLSTEVTAQRLGCAHGTVLSRLSRARDRLRSRLERRDVSLEALWPVGAAADRLAWTGTVPSSLARGTIRACAAMGLAGAAIEGVVPATVAALWVEGKVIDRSSGRPLRAIVRYVAFRDNPHVKDYPDATIYHGTGLFDPEYRTDADGRFRAVALPGGGLLVVRSPEPGYLTARPLTPRAAGNVLDPHNFAFMQGQFQAIVPIDPRPGEVLVLPDIGLTPGRRQHVRPVGPDGRPVERTLNFGEEGRTSRGDIVPGPEFTFVHPRPGQPERILIISQDRQLAASVDIKGDEPDPFRVVLHPSGTVTGRLIDEDGRPRPNVRLDVSYSLSGSDAAEQPFTPPLLTGPDGRFRIAGLVPGLSYTIAVIRKGAKEDDRYEGNLHADPWTLKPGEAREWGDVRPAR